MKIIWRYLPIYSIPILGYLAFTNDGWMTWLVVIEAFVLVPFFELLFTPNANNYSKIQEKQLLQSKSFDFLVYSMIPILAFLLFIFLSSFENTSLSIFETLGRVFSMGILFAALGINVGHELGHRHSWFEKNLSKILLLFSQYMHFHIEHNNGHHLHVSTMNDPATSRKNENLYAFIIRSTFTGYLSAWKLENKRLKKLGTTAFSFTNQMIQFLILQIAFITIIGFYFGLPLLLLYLLAASIGIILLEGVNYIEHYGLMRKVSANGIVARVKPIHSWNSNHILGRMLLFELSRHSDHHYMPSRKYQVLRHFDESPQMPTGYPGMLILALIPNVWFRLMNAKIDQLKLNEENKDYLM